MQVRGLELKYGSVTALDGLSLEVASGSVTALAGANGAGKSTTMRVLAGVLPAAVGVVRVAGVDVIADPDEVRHFVGYCPDTGGVIPRATPWEHLSLSARLRRLPDGWQSHAMDLLERFDLTADAHRACSGFSHGMGRRLSVVLATFHQPAVLLLDEPFDGVDPQGVEATLAQIRSAREQGTAVLVSTHLLSIAAQACDAVVVLNRGRSMGVLPSGQAMEGEVLQEYRRLLA